MATSEVWQQAAQQAVDLANLTAIDINTPVYVCQVCGKAWHTLYVSSYFPLMMYIVWWCIVECLNCFVLCSVDEYFSVSRLTAMSLYPVSLPCLCIPSQWTTSPSTWRCAWRWLTGTVSWRRTCLPPSTTSPSTWLPPLTRTWPSMATIHSSRSTRSTGESTNPWKCFTLGKRVKSIRHGYVFCSFFFFIGYSDSHALVQW